MNMDLFRKFEIIQFMIHSQTHPCFLMENLISGAQTQTNPGELEITAKTMTYNFVAGLKYKAHIVVFTARLTDTFKTITTRNSSVISYK